MSAPVPPPAELRELAAKYRALAALRGTRDRGAAAERAELRRWAERFPGCLRELDTLGGPELARRAEAAERAAGGGEREPWLDWIWSYHGLMRAALARKRGLAPEEAARAAGREIDADFARAALRPPGGRLGPLVLNAVGALYGVPAAAVASTLFRVRRPSPYTLA